MRKYLILFSLLTTVLGLQAQYKPLPNINIDSLEKVAKSTKQIYLKTNPLRYFSGPLFLTSEFRAIGEFQTRKNQSFIAGASYIGKGIVFEEFVDSSTSPDNMVLTGYRLQAGYRFYVFNKLLENLRLREEPYGITGFYISPQASYIWFKYSTKLANQQGYYFNIIMPDVTLRTGLQVNFDRVLFDLNIGAGYKDNKFLLVTPNGVQEEPTPAELDFVFKSNLKLILGFDIGIKL